MKRRTIGKLGQLRLGAIGAVALAFLCIAGIPTAGASRAVLPPSSEARTAAFRAADFLLRHQDRLGAIPDEPGGAIVNEDSNLEYALIGLAAAYWRSRDPDYLQALDKGIRWLAAREEMVEPQWRGSWRYAYRSSPPYAPVAVSPGPGVVDARGVDATSALFVYVIYLERKLSRNSALADELAPRAKAALDFLARRDRASDGFFYSSWQRPRRGPWRLWRYRYSADQVDDYLGFEAASRLYPARRREYGAIARFLRRHTPTAFFVQQGGRFAIGRDTDGTPDLSLNGFDGIFPLGYLPWGFGRSPESRAAYAYLAAHTRPGGAVSIGSDGPYSLSAALVVLAATGLGERPPSTATGWLVSVAQAPGGGIRDTGDPNSPIYSNVCGWTIAALLGAPSF